MEARKIRCRGSGLPLPLKLPYASYLRLTAVTVVIKCASHGNC